LIALCTSPLFVSAFDRLVRLVACACAAAFCVVAVLSSDAANPEAARVTVAVVTPLPGWPAAPGAACASTLSTA
jgi:hypothetical protein